MEIQLRTLTPLWTGGVDGRCDRVHETGIIGSLRWWYEAIVRGLGGEACDPTTRTESRCQDAQRCMACDLFGCTGWARRFRLQLDTGELAYPQQHRRDLRNFKPPGRNTGWYYGAGQLALEDAGIGGQLIVLRGDYNVANTVLVTMQLAATWGGVGARTQHGYGVVKIQAKKGEQSVQADPAAFLAHQPAGALYDGPLPALTDFFFSRFQLVADVPDQWWRRTDANKRPLLGAHATTLEQWGGGSPGSVPIAPAVKNQLRYGSNPLKTRWRDEQRYVFGHIGHQRRKAKINVSGAYRDEGQWTFRVWGWLPRERTNFDRTAFLNDLHTVLHNQAFWRDVFGAPPLVDLASIVWREFDSPRDTVGRTADVGAFLTSLLTGEEGT